MVSTRIEGGEIEELNMKSSQWSYVESDYVFKDGF